MSSDSSQINISPDHQRSIRSFVKRSGRQTERQKYALKTYGPLYSLKYIQQSQLNLTQLFPGLKGVKLEIGFGNGETLVQMAEMDKAYGYIGLEVHTPGVGHCLQQIYDKQLTNLQLISHDAIEVLQFMIPDDSLDGVFLFFPDPWHKKRHQKRRIVNQYFRELLLKKCKSGAVLHMATDWQDYAEYMASELMGDTGFVNLGNEQGISIKPQYRPQTKFERRGLKLGHGVWDLLFAKA